MSFIHFENSRLDNVNSFFKFRATVDVLRLDLIHPLISGNKWFKLKKYFEDVQLLQKKAVVTFGGAFSNHVVATAAAAKNSQLKSIGIIRGEKPLKYSHTLLQAMEFKMELYFISREDYKNKKITSEIYNGYISDDLYFINEGGYGIKGAEGAKDILKEIDSSGYTHIIAATGTGTTLAGLVKASAGHQKIIGISVLKNNFSLQPEIEKLLPPEKHRQFSLLYDYHFGGYAKYTQQLVSFINDWYKSTGIPSDFVYTGKLFFAVNDLIQKNYFPDQSNILIIHSGGLQGNMSLPKGTLIF